MDPAAPATPDRRVLVAEKQTPFKAKQLAGPHAASVSLKDGCGADAPASVSVARVLQREPSGEGGFQFLVMSEAGECKWLAEGEVPWEHMLSLGDGPAWSCSVITNKHKAGVRWDATKMVAVCLCGAPAVSAGNPRRIVAPAAC